MPDDDDDLAEAWADLKFKPPKAPTPEALKSLDVLKDASDEAYRKVADEHKSLIGQTVTPELFNTLAESVAPAYFEAMFRGIKLQTFLGVVEIICQSRDLPPEALRRFIGSLPDQLVNGVNVDVKEESIFGVQALLAFEEHYRSGTIASLTMFRNDNGEMSARILTHADEEFDFSVYEKLPLQQGPPGEEEDSTSELLRTFRDPIPREERHPVEERYLPPLREQQAADDENPDDTAFDRYIEDEPYPPF